jgi:hypothetical protein
MKLGTYVFWIGELGLLPFLIIVFYLHLGVFSFVPLVVTYVLIYFFVRYFVYIKTGEKG